MKKLLWAGLLVLGVGAQMGWAQGHAKRIAVFPIATAANVSHWWSGNFDPGAAMTALVTEQLTHSQLYAVYDRQNMDKIAQEQNLGMAGQVTPETAARVGKLAGVQYLVNGTVVEFDEVKRSGVSGFNIPGVPFSVGGGGKRVRVTLELHFTNVNTGQISAGVRSSADAVANNQAFSAFIPGVNVGVAADSEEFASSALGKAMTQVANETVQKLEGVTFNEAPAAPAIEGTIIDIAGPMITLNVGSNAGIAKGMKLTVSRARTIVDPTSNATRVIHSPVGDLTVIAVESDTCTCKAAPGAVFKVKDVAKLGE